MYGRASIYFDRAKASGLPLENVNCHFAINLFTLRSVPRNRAFTHRKVHTMQNWEQKVTDKVHSTIPITFTTVFPWDRKGKLSYVIGFVSAAQVVVPSSL